MNYRIIAGYLIIDKRLFTKESIVPGSYLRWLLGLEGQWSKKVKSIKREGKQVRVVYDKNDAIYLNDDLNNFVRKIQKTYGEGIKGEIIVSKLRGMRDFLDMKITF